jgi:hypothetical protein
VETFVVRVFVPTGDDPVQFSGLVERAGSGRAEVFSTPQGLIDAVVHELSETSNESRAVDTKEAE